MIRIDIFCAEFIGQTKSTDGFTATLSVLRFSFPCDTSGLLFESTNGVAADAGSGFTSESNPNAPSVR